jgi:hypothetical protein
MPGDVAPIGMFALAGGGAVESCPSAGEGAAGSFLLNAPPTGIGVIVTGGGVGSARGYTRLPDGRYIVRT